MSRRVAAGLLAGIALVLGGVAPATGGAATPTLLAQRMQLFRDGALRGFALEELPRNKRPPYSEGDFRALAATGANVVRVAIQLRKCSGCTRYEVPHDDIAYAEFVLDLAGRHGLRVVVVLQPTPWGDQSDYWQSDSLKADIVAQWADVARQLKGFAALQAYDLINEPVVPGRVHLRSAPVQWHELATAIAQAVRAADPDTPLMVEPVPWGLPAAFRNLLPLAGMPGVVYSLHFYTPHEFTHQGLPGYTDSPVYPGNGWDKRRLSQALDDARRFAAIHRVPIFVGEFSCVRWAPDASCPRYLADALALFAAEGWGWAYHCWRCYQGWDAEVPADVPQAQRNGHLPEHRQPGTPALRVLEDALRANRPFSAPPARP